MAVGLLLVLKFFGNNKGDAISFLEAKMIEGEVEDVTKGMISLKTIKLNFELGLIQEKGTEEFSNFAVHEKIKISEYINDLKSEDDFRKEESDYIIWQKKADMEKSIFDFRFAPVWNRGVEISLPDLKKGDSVRLIYYNDGKKNIAVNIVKNIKEEIISDLDVVTLNAEVNFSAELIEILTESIKVKSLTAIDQNNPEGTILDLPISTDVVIRKATIKSEIDFRAEEKKVSEERSKTKQAGGNYLTITAASRYTEKDVLINELDNNNVVEIQATINNGKLFVKRIREIIK